MNDVTRILIVEDKSTDYELAQREIRKSLAHCTFKQVETQETFIQALEEFKPDVILSDYSLPSFDGLRALQLAQEYSPYTPVIIWTGSISEDVAVECMLAGASNYVLKDNNKRLVSAISHALAEKQLRVEHNHAQTELRTVTEDLTELICRFQPDGTLTYVNKVYCEYFGKTRDELIGTSFIPRTSAGSQKYIEYFKSFTPEQPIHVFEQDETLPDGARRWREWVDRGFFNNHGQLVEIQSTGRDITDRKLAEERLAESERRFRALIENGMDNISLLAADGTLLWENPAVNHSLGYGQNAFVDRNIFELMHPDDAPWTHELFGEVVRQPRSQQGGTFRLKHKDGSWRWIEATATNMLHEPSVKAVVINYRDVTERKIAEEELKASQSRYQNLVETSHDLIWSVDADGRITFMNRAARDIYGYEPEELIGRSFLEFMDPDHFEPGMFQENLTHTRDEMYGVESYIRHRDGRQIILSANLKIIRDESGTPIGMTGSSRDITQQKQAENALREESNLLRTLIDHLPDRIYAMDKQGRKTLSNIADWKSSGGKKMEDVLGKTDFDIYPPELAEPFWQVDKAVLESGQAVINFEEPGLDFEGNPVAILTSKIPLRDEAGNVIGLVGVGRDISQRKLVEEELREKEQRYRTLFEEMPIAIWEDDFSAVKTRLDALKANGVTDLPAYLESHPEEVDYCNSLFKILDVNQTAVQMYRAKDKQHLIQNTLDEPGQGELEHTIDDLLAIAAGKTGNSWEGPDKTCDGKPLEIRMNWSVVPGYEANYSKVIVSTIDITERKQIEESEREQRTLAEALRDTAQILNSTLDYGEVLDHILAAVERVVPHSAATIMLIEGESAHVVRSHGYDKLGIGDEILGVHLALKETTNLWQMLQTQQPVVVFDTHTYPGWKRMQSTDWLRSNVGAPISIQGEVIGFILLDSETPHFFKTHHAERLKAFANQAALAIHNARLLQQARGEITERKRTETELQQKNEDLRLLNIVNSAIVRGQDLDSIVNLLTVELKRIFSAVGSTLYMLNPEKTLVTMQQYSFSPDTEHKIEKLLGFRIPKIEIPIKDGGHFHNALITRQSVITSDPQKIQAWIGEFAETRTLPSIARAAIHKLIPHIYKILNIKSTIIVPLISQEEVIGFLDVSGPSIFTQNDRKRIENIAEQLTLLIQRQQANERVRKSQEFLQGIQNSLSAHLAILDEHGTIIQVNEAWRRFGDLNGLQSPYYGVGMNYFAVCEAATGPEAAVAQEITAAIRQVLTGERNGAMVEYACHGPTEKRWFTVSITCFNDGAQKWVILAHENITERKTAEIAAMESMTQFRTLFEASPDAIILIDPNNAWRVVDCNSATCKMNGYTREELIGQSVDFLNTLRDTPEGRAKYMEQIRSHDVLRYETRHVHKDGTILEIEVSTTLIQLGDRELVLGIDRDITARKLIEKRLQQSEARYRTVVENQTEFIVRWKTDGTRTFVNDAYCRYFGVTQEEALGKDFLILVHEEDRQAVAAKTSRLLSGASSLETDIHRVIRPDGTICWNEWTDQAIYDENGQLIEFQAVGRDITERKIAEQELRDSEERFRQLAHNIEEAFWITDAQTGQELYLSPAVEKVWGISARQLMEEPDAFIQCVIPEDRSRVVHGIEREKQGEKWDMEYRIKHRDGSIHWIWDRAFPVIDEDGTVIKLTGISTDVTERKAAEVRLRESEERFSSAFEFAPIGIALVSLDGQWLKVNQALCQLLGYSSEELLSRTFQEITHPEDLESDLKNVNNLLAGEKFSYQMEKRYVHKSGEVVYVILSVSLVRDHGGNPQYFISQIQDITQRKRAEEALLTSEERYRGLFRNLVNGFALHEIVAGSEGRPTDYIFLEVNPAFEELTRLRSSEILGRRVTEILPEDETEKFISIYGQVALTGQPVHFETYSPALGKYFEINAYSPQPNRFATTFVDITQRKQAEQEIERRAQETAALLEASLSLTNLDLNAILQNIGNSAKNLFEADGCRIFLMQPDGRSLRCVLALQENAGLLANLQIKLGEGVTGSVALHGRAEIVNEMHKDPRAGHIPGTTDDEHEAIMFAPIKERDRTLGVLSVRRAGSDRPFVPAELELLEAFASMAASAVSNARLFEQTERRLSELEALYENGLAVGRLLEPKEIGEHVIQTFANHLSWHHVAIRLIRPDTNELELIAYNVPGLDDAYKDEIELHFNQMIKKPGQGLSGTVLQSGIPLRTGDVHAHPQYVVTQAGIHSGLYMPLKAGQRVIGVISVESEKPDAFTEQDERLLATLANQAAVAFENARLYQSAQQEILERRRAQEALWASETHYRQLADSITDILFELDKDLRYTHWNKASEMFSGVPAEDAIGRTLREVWGTAPEQLQREEIYKSVLRERESRTFETEVIARGEKRALEIRAYPSAHGVSVVARDVTERKMSERLLEKRFALIEYSSRHSLAEVMQKVIDEVSDLTQSHIGFMHLVEPDEITINLQTWSTQTQREFCQAEGAGKHYPLNEAGVWADALRERLPVIHNNYRELPHKKGLPEGHAPVIREMVIPIIRGEKIVAVMGVGNKEQDYTPQDAEFVQRFADYAWDITERKQMETALADERNQLAQRVEERTADLSRANSNLARALRVKDEFLANMSHELRTPLNAILGLSESLSEQVAGPLNEKQQKYLSTINESGHHLLSLINDILDLAKIEAGQITLDINKVDVNSVCQASLRMIKQLAQRKNQDVKFDIDGNLGWMWADERRLKQMIVNLLSNAVKFTPESGTLGLEVRGDEAANRISISVWDRGIGISDRDLGRLFQPFVQLDAGLAREASGTGLGLTLVAQMARLHGGSVAVESHHGQGSRFTILLPWEPAMVGDVSSRLRSTGKFRAIKPDEVRPTILLIEDTQEVVMMLVDYLEMAGFRMVTAQDGVDGLTQAKLCHPDLILMDIQMPRMDGFETTKRLRNDPEFKETPIIALTALAMPNDRQRCLDVGMNEYMSKPVNLKALAKTIKTFLYEAEAGSS